VVPNRGLTPIGAARVRGVDSVPLIMHLLGVGGGGQPPVKQPAEGVKENLPLIQGEGPPDRVALM
jgi:hypothetical protein